MGDKHFFFAQTQESVLLLYPTAPELTSKTGQRAIPCFCNDPGSAVTSGTGRVPAPVSDTEQLRKSSGSACSPALHKTVGAFVQLW
jgi:hypothetical protein